jgi:hypothetical protein
MTLSAVFSDAGRGLEALQAFSHDLKSVKTFEDRIDGNLTTPARPFPNIGVSIRGRSRREAADVNEESGKGDKAGKARDHRRRVLGRVPAGRAAHGPG